MKKPILIGLTGYAGSGKDTVREILERQHDYYGIALADPIRAMLRQLLAHSGETSTYITDRRLKEQAIPALGVSYRHLAQSLGTEWGRSMGQDFWTRIAESHIHDVRALQFDCPQPVVVSDIRFLSEVGWVRKMGGVIWRVQRLNIDPVREHQSETEVGHIREDLVIHNNSGFDELAERVAFLLTMAEQGAAA